MGTPPRRRRNSKSLRRLEDELRRDMIYNERLVWIVPIEEEYSAMVTGSALSANYKRYIKNTTVEMAIEDGLITQDTEMSYTPLVMIPDRELHHHAGLIEVDTTPMKYGAYQIHWALPRVATYQLDMDKLGEGLRAYRDRMGWDWSRVAKKLGTSTEAVAGMECGHTPDAAALLRVLMLLKVKDYKDYMVHVVERRQ